MHTTLHCFLFCVLSSKIFWSQHSSYQGYIGPLVSNKQNLQQFNPSVFLQNQSICIQFQGAFLTQLPGLQNIAFDLKFKKRRCYFDQHFCYQGINSYHNFSYVSNLGLSLDDDLKIGVGIGFQSLIQDSYYGNYWSVIAKFGLQYQQDAYQSFGFSFELYTNVQQSILTFAYVNSLGPELLCFAHLIWIQSFMPQYCFGLEQKFDNYLLRYFAAIQPQKFGCELEKLSAKPAWSFGIHWQNKIGIGLFWNLQIGR